MSKSEKKTISADKERPLRIVVIGANFSGLTTAIHLSRDFNVTVIDFRPQFEFLPNPRVQMAGSCTRSCHGPILPDKGTSCKARPRPALPCQSQL